MHYTKHLRALFHHLSGCIVCSPVCSLMERMDRGVGVGGEDNFDPDNKPTSHTL